ncbi:MAG: SDR family NAD(P)-dependent oxidoreductase [Anaerolineales bacterium]|nr:SDR family NAD(P)-dependent oxidoreductase [Anaerolineales bacterium]
MRIVITGGAGFIGSNTAAHFLAEGHEIIVIDDLSRPGSEVNLAWLFEMDPNLAFYQIDMRDYAALRQALDKVKPIDILFHFAAQVAVTTSVSDPRLDFSVNALGTFNVLEAVRTLNLDPVILFTSTNKVYGALESIVVIEDETRYRYRDLEKGVPETTPLDFYSPYGCSKGAADQYVHDYGRIYGLKTIVFRNSCIYGPRQFGVEDQGWLAWFIIAALKGRDITIYGNGKQVRDILHVSDLIRAMAAACRQEAAYGGIFNMGGGPQNSISVWTEFSPILEKLLGRKLDISRASWRPGDQNIYISDTTKARQVLEWKPKFSVRDGIQDLFQWVSSNLEIIG